MLKCQMVYEKDSVNILKCVKMRTVFTFYTVMSIQSFVLPADSFLVNVFVSQKKIEIKSKEKKEFEKERKKLFREPKKEIFFSCHVLNVQCEQHMRKKGK